MKKRGTRFHYIWKCMRERCNNPNHKSYKHYGGRGITICEEWNDSSVFIAWCEKKNPPEGHRLDRIKVHKGYSPRNCRFISNADQQRNKTNNVVVYYEKKRWILTDLVRHLGVVSVATAHGRTARGWEPLKAATTPVRKRKIQ